VQVKEKEDSMSGCFSLRWNEFKRKRWYL